MGKQMHGQSAVEYVITYGWMVIAIVALMAVLFAIGVFNPQNWLAGSNEAVGLSTFSFYDYTIRADGYTTIAMKSESAYQLNVTAIEINGANLTGVSPSTPITFNPGQTRSVTGTSNVRGNSGDSIYNMRILIYFDVSGGGSHTDSGTLRGKIS